MPAAARPAQTHAHPHTGGPALAKPKLYNPRHPEQTLLYRTVAENFETWFELASAGQFDGQGDHHTPAGHVEQAFRKYLECGIFAHGFARARCDDCGHVYFVAFSCKGRGVCPSCNTRRMVETAAHLSDQVFPRQAVRQWVLSVPKRLRYFMQRDGAVLNMVLRIFLRVIAQSLQAHCPGALSVDKTALHIGAVTRCCRCCARCAAGRCASSPSSRTVPISAKYSTTSVSSPNLHTSPRHAGHRCGRNVMRRWARGSKPSQTGIWRRN